MNNEVSKIRIQRVVDLRQPERKARNPAPHCEVPGCDQTTRERKPYCPEHIDLMPHVSQILERLAVQEEEIEHADKGKRVQSDSMTAREILQHLQFHGARSVPRLARELNISSTAAEVFVRSLLRRRLVWTSHNKRGSLVVRAREESCG